MALLLLAPALVGAAGPDSAAVLGEINRLRSAPSAYAAELRRAAARYTAGAYSEADGTAHGSIEGPRAVLEAAAALDRQPVLPPLAPDRTLAAAARDLGEAQGRDGSLGHVGPGGTTPGERVRRRGGDIYVAEVIAYGMDGAADAVRELVVDDGRPDRGHRKLLLTGFYRYAGVWCGPHATQGTLCVVDLAAGPAGRPFVPAG